LENAHCRIECREVECQTTMWAEQLPTHSGRSGRPVVYKGKIVRDQARGWRDEKLRISVSTLRGGAERSWSRAAVSSLGFGEWGSSPGKIGGAYVWKEGKSVYLKGPVTGATNEKGRMLM